MQEKFLGFSNEWKSFVWGRIKDSDTSTQSRGVMLVLHGPGKNPFPALLGPLGCIAPEEAAFGNV